MSDEGQGRGVSAVTGPNRTATGVLLLALVSPLAFWLAPRGGGTREVTAVPMSSASSTVPSPSPPDHCLSRFASPFREFNVSLPGAPRHPGNDDFSFSAQTTLASDGATLSHGTITKGDAATRDWASTLDGISSQLTEAGVQTTKVIVATLPDPIDSGLTYQFDALLQAVRLGIERKSRSGQQFFRGRGWLPWEDQEVRPAKRLDSEECRTSTPGVVLFRGASAEESELFVLLLVGETPTAGVHVDAMVNAFSAARALSRCRGSTECDGVVTVVGPTFSGSATSLRFAADVWRRSVAAITVTPKIRFRTGTATGPSLRGILERPASQSKLELGFWSTTVPEADLSCAYLKFLRYRLLEMPDEKKVLEQVAILTESGTEFGASGEESERLWKPGDVPCELEAGVHVAFPLHVSALRDAYEVIDRQRTGGDATIARHTSLDISLRERRRALDIGATPSEQMMYAQDLALSKGLLKISEGGIRHVGIHATDIFDAIFLARKVRDVAPDVRLAFFESDVLLGHPTFRKDLLGSLVLTPYPFLGTNSFSSLLGSDPHRHQPFESGIGQGTFNAVLAARGFDRSELAEYGFAIPSDLGVLPIWIAAVGRTGFVPLSVRPTDDCGDTLYGRSPSTANDEHCRPPAVGSDGDERWKKFNILTSVPLSMDRSAVLPRFWHVVFVVAILLFVFDLLHVQSTRLTMSARRMPATLERGTDRAADLAIGRMKWELYASVRGFLFALVFAYVALLEALAIRVWQVHVPYGYWAVLVVAAGCFVVATRGVGLAIWRFARDYNVFARAMLPIVADWRRLRPRSWCSRLWVSSGLARPEGFHETVMTSHGQVGRLACTFVIVAVAVFILLMWETLNAAEGWEILSPAGDGPAPKTTLYIIRSLSLANGLSPVTPTLLCISAAYVWVVGRMARLKDAHDMSLISPPDGVLDLVSTPIRFLLGAPASAHRGANRDDGLAAVERRVINAIWRPSTGAGYCTTLIVLTLVPLVLLRLKPPSTLESERGTVLLAYGMGLSSVLVGATLLQLLEYWSALRTLLRRVMEHRLSRAFANVEHFVREPLEDQVSRSPHDLLRLARTAQEFGELAGLARRWGPVCEFPAERTRLETDAAELREMRQHALLASVRSPPLHGLRHYRSLRAAGSARKAESALGKKLIETAQRVSCLLERAWSGRLAGNPPAALETATAPAGRRDPSDDDALSPVEASFSAAEVDWLRRAQVCTATTVAILINRYVRQFRYFAYTLHGCALLLLVTYASYPFEPHRLMMTIVCAVVASVVVVTLGVFLELDRNTLISHIAATRPGQVTVNGALALRVFAWAVIPLLGLAATQYPDVANALYQFVEPFARAFR